MSRNGHVGNGFGGGGGVPEFDRNGTALIHKKRLEIAQKRGICIKCGIKTHEKKVLRERALTNEHVHQGVCIRCNPDEVPDPIFKEWQKSINRGTIERTTKEGHKNEEKKILKMFSVQSRRVISSKVVVPTALGHRCLSSLPSVMKVRRGRKEGRKEERAIEKKERIVDCPSP